MIGMNYDMLEVLVASIMAIFLYAGILISSKNIILGSNTDVKFVKLMIWLLIMNLVADVLTRAFDGSALPYARAIVYITNYFIFLSGGVAGPLFMSFVLYQIYGYIHKIYTVVIFILAGFTLLLLVINIFIPAYFYIDNSNCYKNGPLYYLYAFNMFICGLIMVIVCIREKVIKGTLDFFSPFIYILPIVFALIIQAVFPRASVVIPMCAISGVFVIFSLLNEAVYRDKLTGLYNRFYLDKIIIKRKAGMKFSNAALMMDVNSFKSINDKYGHEEGDSALVAISEILTKSVLANGKVIRYAGDEFVVILHTNDSAKVEKYISELNEQLSSYNRSSGKGYQLSLAIGYEIFDTSVKTTDELMNVIDNKMYEQKKIFYASHPRIDRRRS